MDLGLGCTYHTVLSWSLITDVHHVSSDIVDGGDVHVVHAAVLDFSKAFDLVPHHLLMKKMLKYNIDIVI